MGKCIFEVSKVKELLEDSINASERRPTYSQLFSGEYDKDGLAPVGADEWPDSDRIDSTKIPAGLMLVGDCGVYLMSNNQHCKKVEGSDSLPVAYAKGTDPSLNDDYDVVKRRLFGGDDGVEFIDAEWIKETIDEGAKRLIINLNADAVEISFTF